MIGGGGGIQSASLGRLAPTVPAPSGSGRRSGFGASGPRGGPSSGDWLPESS
jgi:hypothetical protein